HVTGYDVEAKAFHPKLKKEDGVQCESCHGPASLHLPAGKKAKMSKDASDIELHQTFPKAENCVKCHNDESPSWNPERFTLK
ncbi:MAG: multiheme c-type cytochrome, partial [Candidatus Hydrogenedentes bacterium]|nr:multiheme c-type cytochrome [Candidatus Hydrogenedentota bacterium]